MSDIAKYIILLVLAAGIIGMTACNHKTSDKKIIIASIEPQKWLLEQIVGDKMDIRIFLPANVDPENFDPPISLVKDAANSVAFMKTGYLPWEDLLTERIKDGNKNIIIFDTSVGIIPITDTHKHKDKKHENIDPHIWSSVKNAKIIAGNMVDNICEIDPQNSAYYRANFEQLSVRLNSMDQRYDSLLSNASNRNFIVYHPILSYFARDYNLMQIPLGNDGKEFSLSSLYNKITELDDDIIYTLFYQPNGEESKLNSLINNKNIKWIEINPTAADWNKEMDKIVNALI